MSNSPSNGGNAAIIQPPNALRSRLGGRLPNIDPSAIAKAEAALKGLSAQFGEWLRDEVAKLDAAHTALKAEGPTQACADAVYSRAHDLKGLGTTYGFPLVTRIAGSLCRLLGEKDDRTQARQCSRYRQSRGSRLGRTARAARQRISGRLISTSVDTGSSPSQRSF